MKETRSILNSLVACGVALAMVSTLAAQTVEQGSVKILRVKGAARYSTGNNVWQPLKAGDVVRPGTVIQTAGNSYVDLAMGEGAAPVTAAVPTSMMSYQPTAEQNALRIWENTVLGVDKLTAMRTGADVVTDTQLDLKAGHITAAVKKMSAASKYEVKIPSGVAGIRGTFVDIRAEGVIKVLNGSAVLAYVGPNGSVVTQVINALQQFDARTGVLSPLPGGEQSELENLLKTLQFRFAPGPVPVSANMTVVYISPH
jgi:FecR protein